ncbi:CD209 antigen-like protein A [Xyrichtys novacula]|uniref:CD209 antigen-like protein A n=1 Tax=Xyrichtys novacula TaxID=13765 RepID=A0AAV1EY13_XYRNO|nr:CD209 antigen-like protein A [Xyrichtys novacula]
MDYVPARRKSCSEQSSGATAAVNGMKLFRVVAVSFGLLCILQVVLNISLRFAHNISDDVGPDPESSYQNLTEREQNNFNISDNVGPDLESSYQNLTEREQNNFDKYFQEGWVHFYSSLYYISPIKTSWQKSRNDCLSRGADLAIINSREEQNFLGKINRMMWIGLTRERKQDTWVWVDGSPLNQSYWDVGEPNNYQGKVEDCVEVNHEDAENSWNDRQCKDLNLWICEKTVAF